MRDYISPTNFYGEPETTIEQKTQLSKKQESLCKT